MQQDDIRASWTRLQRPTPRNQDVRRRLVQYVVCGIRLDLVHDVHPAGDLAEHDVPPVAPWRGHGRDEELQKRQTGGREGVSIGVSEKPNKNDSTAAPAAWHGARKYGLSSLKQRYVLWSGVPTKSW